MSLLARIFSTYFSKANTSLSKSNYIFYKIIASSNTGKYTLQCINKNAVFYASIEEIVLDPDILYGLHPTQACYVGLEYINFLKISNQSFINKLQLSSLNKYSESRYGKYRLLYQNRSGQLCFGHSSTNDEFVMDPRDIALSEELISKFDAIHAFFIGISAGIKITNPIRNGHSKFSHLRVVK